MKENKEKKEQSDMQPFVHGEEGTHSCCNARIKKEGGKARCCYCVPHEGCEFQEKKECICARNEWRQDCPDTSDHRLRPTTPDPLTSLLQSVTKEFEDTFGDFKVKIPIDWSQRPKKKKREIFTNKDIKSFLTSKLTEAFNKGTQHGKGE